MLIVADENMPRVREWFAPLGEVVTIPGRNLDAAAVRDADALLVRSVTRVDRALLDGSRVRFVGSATIGTDHLDLDYLRASGIACANAPGCNADAVVDYVLSSLCALDGVLERLLGGDAQVGIVGLGNVGGRLYRRLSALGIRCLGHDPLLAAASALPRHELATVLAADVICCHTPLTRGGPHPTFHLLDAARLEQLRSGKRVLINAGRGGAVDTAALTSALDGETGFRAVLDVWEDEPAIDGELLRAVSIATPHIAGYSLDGKLAGTRMVLEAFCRFAGVSVPLVENVESVALELDIAPHSSVVTLVRAAVQAVYDVRGDDQRLRAALSSGVGAAGRGAAFDALRKHYPERREIAACHIANPDELSAEHAAWLRRLGFVVPLSQRVRNG